MQILITRKKLAERRNPHLVAYQAVPQRLGEQATSSKEMAKKDWGVKNKQHKSKVTIDKVSFPITSWKLGGKSSHTFSNKQEGNTAVNAWMNYAKLSGSFASVFSKGRGTETAITKEETALKYSVHNRPRTQKTPFKNSHGVRLLQIWLQKYQVRLVPEDYRTANANICLRKGEN